jgi:hypothetical protein
MCTRPGIRCTLSVHGLFTSLFFFKVCEWVMRADASLRIIRIYTHIYAFCFSNQKNTRMSQKDKDS